jgi:hypothetical protein
MANTRCTCALVEVGLEGQGREYSQRRGLVDIGMESDNGALADCRQSFSGNGDSVGGILCYIFMRMNTDLYG